ncbi:pyruvate dehydrogenase [acetyl-transferring]-phosphatase 1, mitochondrial-like [Babylonia areolata]|uniref:pyruvate dehydrogenase [acetyl-transferring]-phosphatase 1, mitochondrial-like n=1 Tax=Babylonia areolata TaxID=304850 RepID=UPI003FCF62E1
MMLQLVKVLAVSINRGSWLWPETFLGGRARSGGGSPLSLLKRTCHGPSIYRGMGIRQKKKPDAVESPRLTPKKVSAILQMNEESVTAENYGPIKAHAINILQANNPNEDRNIQGRLLHGGASVYSVIDGHSGSACAQAVSDYLCAYIAVATADQQVLMQICDGVLDPVTGLIKRHGDVTHVKETDLAALKKKNLKDFAAERLATYRANESVNEALVKSFVRLDEDITVGAMPSNWKKCKLSVPSCVETLAIAFSGAVVCAAYIDNTDLLVANAGDSMAVLGVHNNDRWEAVPLSNIHDAQNPYEVERITKNHPNESSNIIRNGRLFGALMPLRAFGNVRFKWAEADLRDLQNNSRHIPKQELMNVLREDPVPQTYLTPPYLDAEPEVVRHKLTPKDKFLVLASDGLWDCLSADKVVELVGGHMEGERVLANYSPPKAANLKVINSHLKRRLSGMKNQSLDSNAATHLLRSALGTDHGQVSAQLTLPPSMVRQFRDDITIIIVFFDSKYIRQVNVKH